MINSSLGWFWFDGRLTQQDLFEIKIRRNVNILGSKNTAVVFFQILLGDRQVVLISIGNHFLTPA